MILDHFSCKYFLSLVLWYENYDLDSICTPVEVSQLEQLLDETNYNESKKNDLINGFTNGFSLGFDGELNKSQNAPNLKLHVRSLTELWNKVMKEVKDKRFAGPYEAPLLTHTYSPPFG